MKVAWLTWLPVNGWAAVELQKHLNGNGDPIELVALPPQKDLTPSRALQLAGELSREYDAVAFMPNPVILEAARNYKIQNFRKQGVTFARWLCPDFFEEGRKVRWCQVG